MAVSGAQVDGQARRRFVAALSAFFILALSHVLPSHANEERAQRHVLVLMSYHHGHSWEDRILRGFEEALATDADKPVLHVEWLDTKRHATPEDLRRFNEYLTGKYGRQKFDLVATADDNALLLAVPHPMLKDVPIVFSGVNGNPAEIVGQRRGVTGIAERFDLLRTMRLALSLHPDIGRLIFISTNNESGEGTRTTIHEALATLNPELKIEHWVPDCLEDIEPRLEAAPTDALVFAFGSFPIAEGNSPVSAEDVVAFVRAHSPRPVYSDLDTTVGHGALGGYMNSGLETGRLMGRMAARVLAGVAPESMPVVFDGPLTMLFDHRELSRFRVPPDRLPDGATLINRPPSILDPENRAWLVGVAAAILILLGALGALYLRGRMLASRQQAMRHLAMHDDLTGLPNRSWVREYLASVAHGSSRARGSGLLALAMLDVRRFKLVNDTYGHSLGDELMRNIAHRFQEALKGLGTPARFGGDTFAIVAHLGDQAQLDRLGKRIREALATPFAIREYRIAVTASVGISACPVAGLDGDRLLREADIAMYEAKRANNSHIVVFDNRLDEQTARLALIESALPAAIENGDIVAHFQPIFDSSTQRIAGFEALARWQHPELGWIPPNEFVAIATESGVIRRLTLAILRSACRAFRPMLDIDDAAYLAVNVSAFDIYAEDFLARFSEILEAEGVPPNRIVLEVTEDMLLGNVSAARQALAAMREAGVRVAIDDFGVGYSSMAYLSRFPVNTIKIDQSFVRDIASNPANRKIVKAMLSMAADLGLTVVTEGVETGEEIALLRSLGSVLLQGYAFGRPSPPAEWLPALHRQARAA